jgi:hypothetical protein
MDFEDARARAEVATPEEKLVILRQHYALNGTGDHARARELLADDFVITIPAFMPFGGTYRGKDAFLELIPLIGSARSDLSIPIPFRSWPTPPGGNRSKDPMQWRHA